jgi:glycosyltransferase involved in cell wall biosynthesis
MRVLVLSKRQYTGRDLLDDRYGRVFEIPAALARRGHAVRGIALSYRRRPAGDYAWPDAPGLSWRSVSLGAFGVGLLRYRDELARAVRDFRPEVVWATSDAYHAVGAQRFARAAGIPLVLDFYDNYESLAASRVPLVVGGMRAAARAAAAVTAVSSTLAEWMGDSYRLRRPPIIVGNAVDPAVFRPRDRAASRQRLGLPQAARIVGMAGALDRSRGIADVFEAFLRLAGSDADLWLAFAGPRDGTPARYSHPRIRDLGVLAPAEVPVLLSSLDVAVVSNVDSDFGRFCFPQKLFEAIACGAPVVAARVGEVERLLAQAPSSLYAPGDVPALATALATALAGSRDSLPAAPTWCDRAERLEAVLAEQL